MSDESSFAAGTGTALDQFTMPACSKTLGYEFVSVDRDAQTMEVRFTATADMVNPMGNVQGGFLMAMLDDVMGSMMVVLTDAKKGPVSVDFHTQFLRPAKVGVFVGKGRVKHMTNSTVFTEATLYSTDGEAVASAVQSQRLFPIRGSR
ncbi:MAG: PaaI family thioesterase [Pseudomonadota bacterium]